MAHQNIDISQPGESKIKPRASVAPEKKSRVEPFNHPAGDSEKVQPDKLNDPDMPNKLYEEQLPPEHKLT